MTDNQPPDAEAPSGGVEIRVWPFHSAIEAIKAAEQYVSGKISPLQRRRLLERLWVSCEFAPQFLPVLSAHLHLENISSRHQFLDRCNTFLDEGMDLGGIVADVARQMLDSNFALREKAAALLVRMRDKAAGATTRALGMLHSKIADIQVNALNLLAAIGPVCAEAALPKVESMLKGSHPSEVLEAAQQARSVLLGEIVFPAADPVIHAVSPLEGKTALVVDDDEIVCAIIREILEKEKMAVRTVKNDEEVASLLATNPQIDIALVDLFLGSTNGAVVIRQIRQHETLGKVPIYVVSSNHDKRIMLALAQFDICGYLLKPFDADELLSRVNNVLNS